MHLVAITWALIVVLMAAAEATSSQGSVLGAFFTLLLYGALPLAIVIYVMGAPLRRRARRRADDLAASAARADGDRSGHPAGDAVAAKREEA